tara:strand:- start:503 stop:853 length:351 start_codon:yes stop_codon:yes gene_type:complete
MDLPFNLPLPQTPDELFEKVCSAYRKKELTVSTKLCAARDAATCGSISAPGQLRDLQSCCDAGSAAKCHELLGDKYATTNLMAPQVLQPTCVYDAATARCVERSSSVGTRCDSARS